MPSIRAIYNDELVEAHRVAVATLRELLSQEKDPLERRKLANAILRARPVKDPEADLSKARPGPRRRAKVSREADLDRDPDDELDCEVQEMARRIMTSPDPLAALRELQALMSSSIAPLSPNASAAESS